MKFKVNFFAKVVESSYFDWLVNLVKGVYGICSNRDVRNRNIR